MTATYSDLENSVREEEGLCETLYYPLMTHDISFSYLVANHPISPSGLSPYIPSLRLAKRGKPIIVR